MKKYTLFLFLCAVFILCVNASLQAQMVGANTFLQSRYLEIGMLSNGSYGAPSPPANYHPHNAGTTVTPGVPLAEVYDYGHDGWTTGSPAFAGDFTYPGLPFEGWEIQVGAGRDQAFAIAGGFTAGGGGLGTTGAFTGYSSSGGNKLSTWVGTALSGQLVINMESRLDTEASWIMIKVKLRNTGATPLSNVYYLRTFDADLDQTWGGGFSTYNWITYQNDAMHRSLISTKGYITPAFMGLSAVDNRAKVFTYSAWPMSASQDLAPVYAGTFPTGVYATGAHLDGDNGLGLIFNLGNIAAGDSTMLSYAYVFNDSTGVDSAQASLCGGPLTAGTPSPNLTSACATTPLSISLPGALSSPVTAYQWQSSPDSATWANIAGATSVPYNFTGITVTTYYRCIVTCTESGASETSPGAKITYTTVCPCPGLSGGTVTTNVTTACATTSIILGDTGYLATGVTLQWQSSPDSSSWTDIAGATAVPYTFSGLGATTYYRLAVTCTSVGITAYSAGQKITFTVSCPCPTLVAGTSSSNFSTACPSTSITLSNIGYTATGTTLQWQSSTDSSTWSDIAGATAVPYTFSGLAATTYYRLVVTCVSSGSSVASAGVKVNYTASCTCVGLSAGIVTSNVTIACPTTSVILGDFGYTSTGVTYQWQASHDSVSWTNIPITTVSYMFTGLGTSTYFRLVVTCTLSGTSVASAGKLITYIPCSTTNVGTIDNDATVEIFPNPAHDELTIKAGQGMYTSYVVTNTIGQQVLAQDITGTDTKVGLKSIPAGVYYITLRGAQGSEVKQFVKW